MKYLIIITIMLFNIKAFSQTFEIKDITVEQTNFGFTTTETNYTDFNVTFKNYTKVGDNSYNTFEFNTKDNSIKLGIENITFDNNSINFFTIKKQDSTFIKRNNYD